MAAAVAMIHDSQCEEGPRGERWVPSLVPTYVGLEDKEVDATKARGHVVPSRHHYTVVAAVQTPFRRQGYPSPSNIVATIQTPNITETLRRGDLPRVSSYYRMSDIHPRLVSYFTEEPVTDCTHHHGITKYENHQR